MDDKKQHPVCNGKCKWIGLVEISKCKTCGLIDDAYVISNMNKEQTKVYLAGKVSGLNYAEASHKFGLEEVKLIRQGYEVVNPLNIVDKRTPWQDAMRICIAAMMDCQEIYFLPCYKDSPGAVIEHDLALKLGIPVKYL